MLSVGLPEMSTKCPEICADQILCKLRRSNDVAVQRGMCALRALPACFVSFVLYLCKAASCVFSLVWIFLSLCAPSFYSACHGASMQTVARKYRTNRRLSCAHTLSSATRCPTTLSSASKPYWCSTAATRTLSLRASSAACVSGAMRCPDKRYIGATILTINPFCNQKRTDILESYTVFVSRCLSVSCVAQSALFFCRLCFGVATASGCVCPSGLV
jgi:hypothetical protein